MARLPRFVISGQPQHVIQRGNNRDMIFANDDDYRFYLKSLRDACAEHQRDVNAYVLMTPNLENSISKVVQSLGRRYVQYYNDTYDRIGTLWEGRYKATGI